MTESEQQLIQEAEVYIKAHKHELIAQFANPQVYNSVDKPISLFMAGSPGAGKTEVSKRLIDQFTGNLPVRIDSDDIRSIFPNYSGDNSHLFQRACTIGVNKLFDYVLEHNINTILDGTFAYEHAMENIDRSLKHNRRVIIYYLFQEPSVAWNFTKAREVTEGRRVSREVFINGFIRSRENVTKAKAHFLESIELNLIIKDFTKNIEQVYPNINEVDKYLSKVYTKGELENILQ